MYSEKATKICEISTFLLSYLVPVKRKVEILQNFVAFSEYMNFNRKKSREFSKFHPLPQTKTLYYLDNRIGSGIDVGS